MPNNFQVVGSEIQAWLQVMLPRMGVALLAEATAYVAAKNAVFSPVGDAPIDPHPGKLMRSWRASVGSPEVADLRDAPSYPRASGDRMEFIPALAGLQPGQSTYVTNDAKSDRDKYFYASRMIVDGESPKAPAGTIQPTFEALGSDWPAVAEAAILKVLAEGGAP